MNAAPMAARQTRFEQYAFWRNREAAFFTFALPLALLLILGATSRDYVIPDRPELASLTLFVPGILGFGVITASYSNLAVTITTLRSDGVLKRIRATPVRPGAYLAGHLCSTLLTALVVSGATIVLGRVAFGVAPARPTSFLLLALVLAVGITCFAALGLAITAIIPDSTAAGVVTNATFIPLAMVSGTFESAMQLPAFMDKIVSALPIKPLIDALRAAYDPAVSGWPLGDLGILALWAGIGTVLALRHFRWEAR